MPASRTAADTARIIGGGTAFPIARHTRRSARPRKGDARCGKSHEKRGGKPDTAASTDTDGRVASANGAASPARAK
jgi:hypothetical protein